MQESRSVQEQRFGPTPVEIKPCYSLWESAQRATISYIDHSSVFRFISINPISIFNGCTFTHLFGSDLIKSSLLKKEVRTNYYSNRVGSTTKNLFCSSRDL